MKMCSGLDLQLSPNSEEGGESGVGSGKGSSGRTFPGELSKEEACLPRMLQRGRFRRHLEATHNSVEVLMVAA